MLHTIVDTNWEVLSSSHVTKDLADNKPIFGNCRVYNLHDLLVSAKVRQSTLKP